MLGRRIADPGVEAAAAQRVGEIARTIRRHDDGGALRGANRADLGDRDLKLAQQFEQNRFERLVGAVDLVNEQHRRALLHDRFEQRTFDEIGLAEDLGLAGLDRTFRVLGQLHVQQLLGVVPLVQRAGGVDALVALQADEPRVQHLGQDLRTFRLPDAGRTFDQQRFSEREHQLQRGGEIIARDVPVRGETLADRLDGHGAAAIA